MFHSTIKDSMDGDEERKEPVSAIFDSRSSISINSYSLMALSSFLHVLPNLAHDSLDPNLFIVI